MFSWYVYGLLIFVFFSNNDLLIDFVVCFYFSYFVFESYRKQGQPGRCARSNMRENSEIIERSESSWIVNLVKLKSPVIVMIQSNYCETAASTKPKVWRWPPHVKSKALQSKSTIVWPHYWWWTNCHKFCSDPRQTSMCLKRLLCNQGTPPVILTKKKHQHSKYAKAIDNALKVLQNRILHKNPNQNMTQHKKIYQNKTNNKKNTSHIRHTNTTQHKVW